MEDFFQKTKSSSSSEENHIIKPKSNGEKNIQESNWNTKIEIFFTQICTLFINILKRLGLCNFELL